MTYTRLNNDEEDDRTRVEKLKAGASKLSLTLQQQFWMFVSNQAKILIENDSSMFYDVNVQSVANPFSSQTMVEVGGGVGVATRAIKLLLVPLQKLMQYGAWYNANREYEANYQQKLQDLEALTVRRAQDQKTIAGAKDPAEEVIQFARLEDERLANVNRKIEALKKSHRERNPDDVGGFKKPTFTVKDGLYMALDAVLLALAIAALVYGVSIAGAAIATTAAVIAAGAAIVNYGKHLRDAREMKKEKIAVDELKEYLGDRPNNENMLLSKKEQTLVDEQRAKLAQNILMEFI